MKSLSRAVFCYLLILSLAACSSAPSTGSPNGSITLRVFAAASLFDSFNQIVKQFEGNHPGVTVELNFAGSQQLASQISEGAPADIFASADQRQMDVAIQSGQVAKGSEQVFAGNRLVVVLPNANPAKINNLKDLARPGLRLVLAAKEVPVGQYALNFLDKASQDAQFGSGYKDAVLKNVVSYENSVKSVLNKVSLGEADAGIVYLSDMTGSQPQVQSIEIPGPLNVSASYVIAAIKDTPHPDVAKAFIDYLLSEAGQAVLVHYGFQAVR